MTYFQCVFSFLVFLINVYYVLMCADSRFKIISRIQNTIEFSNPQLNLQVLSLCIHD